MRDLQSLFKSLGYSVLPFSGNKMFVKDCLGVHIPKNENALIMGAKLGRALGPTLNSIPPEIKIDNSQQIIYFPTIEYRTDYGKDH